MLDEQIKYAEYAKDNFPVDCVAAAIYWNRNVVDENNIKNLVKFDDIDCPNVTWNWRNLSPRLTVRYRKADGKLGRRGSIDHTDQEVDQLIEKITKSAIELQAFWREHHAPAG